MRPLFGLVMLIGALAGAIGCVVAIVVLSLDWARHLITSYGPTKVAFGAIIGLGVCWFIAVVGAALYQDL